MTESKQSTSSSDSDSPPSTADTEDPLDQLSKDSSSLIRRLIDPGLAALCFLAAFIVHDVGYMLSKPFWVDETWVAVSTRLPLRSTPEVSAVTPLGWTLLLRAMVFGGEHGLRMLPLLFTAATGPTAYYLGRSLAWKSIGWSRLAGILTAAAVLLTPSALARDDLKQYTADACLTLIVLLLVSRVERNWTRTGLAALGASAVVGIGVSAVSMFVASSAFTALVFVQLAKRDWRRLLEAMIAGAITGAVLLAEFAIVYAPRINDALTAYWRPFYLPVNHGLGGVLTYLHRRGAQMATYLGAGPLLLGGILMIVGVVVLFRVCRPAVAATIPLMLLQVVALSAAKKYPLFDERTSHFLTTSFAVLIAVGVAGVCSVIARRQVAVGAAVAVLAASAFVFNVHTDIREHPIPREDVYHSTRLVSQQRQPDDVILLNSASGYGFGYYWHHDTPQWSKLPGNGIGFAVTYPTSSGIVVASGRDDPTISQALDVAQRELQARGGTKIWLVWIHLSAAETRAWKAELVKHRLTSTQILHCQLMTLQPATSDQDAADELAGMQCPSG